MKKKWMIIGIITIVVIIIILLISMRKRKSRATSYTDFIPTKISIVLPDGVSLDEELNIIIEKIKQEKDNISFEKINEYLENSYFEIAKTDLKEIKYEIYDCEDKRVDNYPEYIKMENSEKYVPINYKKLCQNGDKSGNILEYNTEYIVKLFPNVDSNTYYYLLTITPNNQTLTKYCTTHGELDPRPNDGIILEE